MRAKSIQALGLFLLLTVVGFAVADLARGESVLKGTSPGAIRSASGTDGVFPLAGSHEAPAEWLGLSGRLRAVIETPETIRELAAYRLTNVADAAAPGMHDLGIVTPDGDPFYLVSLVPYTEKQGNAIRGYHVGSWPQNVAAARYAHPAGFIEVTPENQGTPVSSHFKLQDFITHDQGSVWPKYLVLKPRLIDKLELITEALAARGLPSKLHVMSGFRTPQYNEQGVGSRGGRARMSRHMYGDAADVFVDEDGNGIMDDLNHDGRSSYDDAQVLFRVAESVEAAHPDLVGGLSAYRASAAHGPFVHVDTRGTKARW
jgi:hypothetical protein